MHGCGSGSALLVNAEVDSMGGVVDGGVGNGIKTSPRSSAIERVQAELRQKYDVREETRRELEFLAKGGNPLDFRIRNGASLSVQSTSLTDQHPEHFVTSEAKGSFALTASPYGDSVESSGRPGVPTVSEPNTADNLLLFDGGNVSLESERNRSHTTKRNCVIPRERGSRMDGTQNAKESEDSAIVRPYARRNRSKPNRDSARSSSTVMIQTRGGHGSLPVRSGSRDAKSISEVNNQKAQIITTVEYNNQKPATSNGDRVSKFSTPDVQLNVELEGVPSKEEITTDMTKDRVPEAKLDISTLPEEKLDVTTSKRLKSEQHNQPLDTDAQKPLTNMVSGGLDLVDRKEEAVSAARECQPYAATAKIENESRLGLPNGFGDSKSDVAIIPNGGQNSSAAMGIKGYDAESTCNQNSLTLDVNNDNAMCLNPINAVSTEVPLEQASELEGTEKLADGDLVNEKDEIKAADTAAILSDDRKSMYQTHSASGCIIKVEKEARQSTSDLQNEMKYPCNVSAEQNDQTVLGTHRKVGDTIVDDCGSNGVNTDIGKPRRPVDIPVSEPEASISGRTFSAATDVPIVDKAYEDSILEEARIIEAKQKRIAELSVGTLPLENGLKSHWYFVLEEMFWLANDFAQERLWKLTAAAQISHRVAFTSLLRSERKAQCLKLKIISSTLAKAVMQFWHSAEMAQNSSDPSSGVKSCMQDVSGDEAGIKGHETLKEAKPQGAKNQALAVRNYAVRFLKSNSYPVPSFQAEAPATPDRMSDLGAMEISWNEHVNEENLFYAVPSRAMENYRKSIESHLMQCEKTGSSMQEEVVISMYNASGEMRYHDTACDEDEGETSAYYLSGGFEGRKSAKSFHKTQKNSMKLNKSRTYEVGTDMPYGHCTNGTQQPVLTGKRPASSLHVGSVPTKRVRTASRQRVVSTFNVGATGSIQVPAKTDASSGDTNSFQDDQNTLHGGSQIQKSVEVESVGDFEKKLPYDYAETSTKPKKKKAKTPGAAYEQGWQLDTSVHNEQRDHSRKRSDSHHFESNGSSGLYGQHCAKKPKMIKQQIDNTFDNATPIMGSIPSPAASQMSNMPNPNKLIKLISGGRDRGRKEKGLKVTSGQPGSGSTWSLFEDQALVVLVHDMGPNWELVSDAINSTLQFKCIYRKPKECKERHKNLMDRSAGDGAESAEDSGSSQSYTLPGIPKGSARQLFQHLQGPLEEDTLRSHFEKIIMIGKKLHQRRCQNENQDSKHIVSVHNSHVIALSQVCPNNLNGGFLTPLDLCNAASSPDVLPFRYHGSHTGGTAIANQGGISSMLTSPGTNSSLQVTPDMPLTNSMVSPSSSLNSSIRDGRYNVPRTPLPVDEQQRTQQYNQMFTARNTQQPDLSVPGADRGVRMLPGGNGMSMLVNRSMPMPRPGLRGIASQQSMMNSGTMLSSGGVGMPSPINIHSGTGPGQGTSVLRPRDALHAMRPGQNVEHQRQLMAPEMQVTKPAAFNGLSSPLSSQTASPPVQTYLGHSQQQHQLSPQQPNALSSTHRPRLQGPNHSAGAQHQYAVRLAKQQRYMQQQQQKQQQQFASSTPLMQHAQSQSQLPSSTLPKSSQIQSQTASQPGLVPSHAPLSTMTPMPSQHPQKHHLAPHGVNRNPQTNNSGLTNQMGKQRQRQPQQQFQQSARHHPQQRQHPQPQQQAKVLKEAGRGNMAAHQNLSVDPSHLNGLSIPPGSQAMDKGEQIMHSMQGPALYSGSTLNPVQPSKPLVSSQSSNNSQPQQKLYSGPMPASKPTQQRPSLSDNSSSSQISSARQTVLPPITASNHQRLQPHPRQVTQNSSGVQRILQQNRAVNPDLPGKSQLDQVQAEKQSTDNVPQMSSGTTVMPPAFIDSTNVAPVSTADPNRKASEPVNDSGMSNVTTQSGSIGSPPHTTSTSCDLAPAVSPDIGPRQLSGSLPTSGHKVGAQWQPHVQQSSTPPQASPQQQYLHQEQHLPKDQQQSPQQLTLQQESQQQRPPLLVGQGSLYIRPTNSKPE